VRKKMARNPNVQQFARIPSWHRLIQRAESMQTSRPLMNTFLLCLLLVIASAVARAEDRVFVKQGTTAQGNISELTPTKVTIEVRNKPQTYPLKEVRKITFDKEPAQLDRARELVLENKHQQAIEELRAVQRQSLEGRIQQEYDFYLSFAEGNLSLAGSGDAMSAIRGLIGLDKANPNSHHHFEIKELLGRLAMHVGKYENAKTFFDALMQSPEDIHKATAIYYQGVNYFLQGKIVEAKEQASKLAASSASSPEVARLKKFALVLNARCENQAGNTDQALQTLNEMADREDNTDLPLFAKINNARGECYSQLNQPQRAAYSYLQTDLLFFTDAESHAEALFHLKKLLVTIGEPAKAAQAGERLTKQYASSYWENKK
jgi:tetratricopeptide (TPR) repeat protein